MWSESDTKKELARRRKEHLAAMELLRGELARLRAQIFNEAEDASLDLVHAELQRQENLRKEWSDARARAQAEIPAAIRAVPLEKDYWDASFHQTARLAAQLNVHPSLFVADVFRDEEPITRKERRESLAEYARGQVSKSEREDPVTKLMSRRMVQAARAGTGMSFTKPDGEVIEMSKERLGALVAAKHFGRTGSPQ